MSEYCPSLSGLSVMPVCCREVGCCCCCCCCFSELWRSCAAVCKSDRRVTFLRRAQHVSMWHGLSGPQSSIQTRSDAISSSYATTQSARPVDIAVMTANRLHSVSKLSIEMFETENVRSQRQGRIGLRDSMLQKRLNSTSPWISTNISAKLYPVVVSSALTVHRANK